MTGAGLSLVLPFCCLHRAFALLFFKIFLHYPLDFIPLDLLFSKKSAILGTLFYTYFIFFPIRVAALVGIFNCADVHPSACIFPEARDNLT